jgi:hypothetical protein
MRLISYPGGGPIATVAVLCEPHYFWIDTSSRLQLPRDAVYHPIIQRSSLGTPCLGKQKLKPVAQHRRRNRKATW